MKRPDLAVNLAILLAVVLVVASIFSPWYHRWTLWPNAREDQSFNLLGWQNESAFRGNGSTIAESSFSYGSDVWASTPIHGLMLLVVALVLIGLAGSVALAVASIKGRRELMTLTGLPAIASLSSSALLFFLLFGRDCELSKVNGGGFSSFYGKEEFIPWHPPDSRYTVQWGPDVGWWLLIASIVLLCVAMLIVWLKARDV